MTHDYTRHGTVTLFAALSVLQGTLISRTQTPHTHVEWLRFLKQIDREAPRLLDLHLIADNYATHKRPKVKAWLERAACYMRATTTHFPLFTTERMLTAAPMWSFAPNVNVLSAILSS